MLASTQTKHHPHLPSRAPRTGQDTLLNVKASNGVNNLRAASCHPRCTPTYTYTAVPCGATCCAVLRACRGVVRARLLEALYQALPDPGSIVSFETSLQGVTQPEAVGGGDAAPLRVQAVCRGQAVELAAAAVIGADGVGSVVASYLGLPPTRSGPREGGRDSTRGTRSSVHA